MLLEFPHLFSSCTFLFQSLIFINPGSKIQLINSIHLQVTVNTNEVPDIISLACCAERQIRGEPWHCTVTCMKMDAIQTMSWNVNIICLHCTALTNRLLYCNVHRPASAAAVAISICSFCYFVYFDLFLVVILQQFGCLFGRQCVN